jgi:RNA polymerase sigma-70 factor (ECF subfamily)
VAPAPAWKTTALSSVPAIADAANAAVLDAADAASALGRRAQRDAELVALLQSSATGNAGAFERFYDLTTCYAQTLARRMLNAADVDDVVADAYFQAWRDCRSFDAERGSPVTWLLTIVRSRALDLLRRRKASPEQAADDTAGHEPADAESPGPIDLLQTIESRTRLHAALATLSPQERWVLALAYYRELSHREVCEQTGMPLGTVKSLILRAQAKLRALLAEGGS